MADSTGNLRCVVGCWLTAALAGFVAIVIMLVVGNLSAPGAIFLGLLLTGLLGVLLSWLLCRPLPTLDEVRARGAGTRPAAAAKPAASSARTSAPASGKPAASGAEASGVKPIGAAAAAEERAADAGSGGRDQPAPIGAAAAADEAASAASGSAAETGEDGDMPAALNGPRGGKPDNLKEIKGVGPKLEKMLNGMGIYHFDQIAGWSDSELAWVDSNLEGFRGRASRDNWVDQARVLAAGGETEFSKRVDEGGVY